MLIALEAVRHDLDVLGVPERAMEALDRIVELAALEADQF
jgi:hypothetical protein